MSDIKLTKTQAVLIKRVINNVMLSEDSQVPERLQELFLQHDLADQDALDELGAGISEALDGGVI